MNRELLIMRRADDLADEAHHLMHRLSEQMDETMDDDDPYVRCYRLARDRWLRRTTAAEWARRTWLATPDGIAYARMQNEQDDPPF